MRRPTERALPAPWRPRCESRARSCFETGLVALLGLLGAVVAVVV